LRGPADELAMSADPIAELLSILEAHFHDLAVVPHPDHG
jgi:hypothetical protein